MNHEYVRLEKRILNGEYLNKLINENNIFTVLEIKSRCINTKEEKLKVIEQLDKKDNKVSLELRVYAISKFFPEIIDSYVFKEDKYDKRILNTDSFIVRWMVNQNITRYGLDATLLALSNIIDVNSEDFLNFLIEINEDILKWHYENFNHITTCTYTSLFEPKPLTGLTKNLIDRYENYLINE